MRNFRIYSLLLGFAVSVALSSCDDESSTDSVITRFAAYEAVPQGTTITATECGNVYTLTFTLNDKQNTDVHLIVTAGESSTATEGKDFEILTHDIDIPAFAGQDGFSVDIAVFQDFEIEQGKESIYLNFQSATPSGISLKDVLVAEIEDSGIDVEPSQTTDFALSWAYADDPSSDVCGFDLDLTFQTAGSSPYGDDLLGFAASTTACVEEGTIDIDDMIDGEVYDIWVFIYAGEATAQDLTVTIDYARENTSFEGTFTIEGVFDSGMEEDGFVVGTIEKNCNVLTIKDTGGNVVAEGRIRGDGHLKSVHNVKKPL